MSSSLALRSPTATPAGLGYTSFAQKAITAPRLADVTNWMKRFAHQGKIDMSIRSKVEEICANVVQGDYASEVLAVYYWVCTNIRYMRDINDVEFVKEPKITLSSRSGDCDDIATLLAAMLMACGNQCSFVVAGFGTPPAPSHVYVQVETAKGPVPLDPVANRETERMTRTMTCSVVIPLG